MDCPYAYFTMDSGDRTVITLSYSDATVNAFRAIVYDSTTFALIVNLQITGDKKILDMRIDCPQQKLYFQGASGSFNTFATFSELQVNCSVAIAPCA